ncbi:MAG TPA: hypothetical protein VFV25_00565 [Methylibium sp.]
MSLPIDIVGSLWFMPTAIWEWEPEAGPAPGSQGAAGCADGGATGGEAVADQHYGMRLVFKGYANTASFHWFAADSLLSRPWTRDDADDAHRRRATERTPRVDEVPRADDDAKSS